MSKEWSNLAKVVYKRTFSRNDTKPEKWEDTLNRAIDANLKPGLKIKKDEKDKLLYYGLNRKATVAGRGLWFSGAPSHPKIGGAALNNCWVLTADDWYNFVIAQDLLMLGGGVGLTVEHRYVSKLPKIKKNVAVIHKLSKDADFIVPDSREGWLELVERTLESFFVTGRSFTYSTVCVRGYGEIIKGFGGVSTGAQPLIKLVDNLCSIMINREGKHLRPIDGADVVCCIGEMVKAGNVRRSAIMVLGDCWDKEYLKAKRWDLGLLPSYRSMANFSVICDDVEDLHPLYWKTYEAGEAFGILNRKNVQMYARMGERKKDTAIASNPCGEGLMEDKEPCNLQEIFLPNISNEREFVEAGKLMHRYGKRVTCENYHYEGIQEVVNRNRRIGTGITGCLQSSLFTPRVLDNVYEEIQKESYEYSKQLNIPDSIRTTVVKPSGTLSLLGDTTPGIHPAYSRYYIRRVRFSANDKLIPILKASGHNMEPEIKLDGSLDHNTLVVDFYQTVGDNTPCADEGFDTWKQLDTLLMAQKHWADQAVSVSVYYKKEEIPQIKEWLTNNLKNLKTISFLCYNDHGFKQAPLEKITKEDFEKYSQNVKDIDIESIDNGQMLDVECEGGVCPVK